MKKVFCLTNVFILLVLLVACDSVVVGSKKYETRTVELPQDVQYDAIKVYDDIDVKVAQGNHAISIYAPHNVQKHISTVIVDDVLVVKYADGAKVLVDEEPVVFVSYPYLVATHSVDTATGQPAHGATLNTLRVEGDGDIEVQALDVPFLTAEVIGGGTISLQGVAQEAVLRVDGSGEIDADRMKATKMTASVDGNGDIECYVLEYLEAHTTALGEIKYQGPAMLQVTTTGRVVRDID